MKRLALLILFIPAILFSQVNESDSLRLKANLSVTGFWQQGNVETVIFRAKSDLNIRVFENMVFKTKNSYVYQEFGKVKADEDILSLNFLYFNPQRKSYPFVLSFFSTNYRREINLRTLNGAGYTFQLYEKEKNWLKLSLSSEFEQTQFRKTDYVLNSYDGQEFINTWRATLWVKGNYELFKKKMILKHEFYYQPSLVESKDYRWQADIGVEFPIWDYISFKVNYLHSFESMVIQGQRRDDKFLTFGLTIKNYK
ncbi:DUF481 domain-containing protein [Nonlabens sp.]|uniref:DUF481 domain-containing protein n=1 Tax=Nonlabens sp. TaxID=1888209 RepID=UPI003F69D4E9